jgi:hypothetical protein
MHMHPPTQVGSSIAGWLGVPALRPGSAIDNPYDAAARRAAHEGSPLADPWLSPGVAPTQAGLAVVNSSWWPGWRYLKGYQRQREAPRRWRRRNHQEAGANNDHTAARLITTGVTPSTQVRPATRT